MMTCESSTEAELIHFLTGIGCCKRCALRYVAGEGLDYEEPEQYIANLEYDQNEFDFDEYKVALKKHKVNPCVICLDLLHDSTLESMLLKPELDDILAYDCESFVNYISYPTSVLIREHSMEIYVKKKFPDFFKDRYIVPINKAWSLSIQRRLAQMVHKKFDRNAYLQVHFNTGYELEKEETAIIKLLEADERKTKGHSDVSSKNATLICLKKIDPDTLERHISIPPRAPMKPLTVETISYKHDFIFLAGRYCKYSRNLFQTPWVLDDNPIVRNSVQEIIFQAIDNMFSCTNMIFSTSGREDFDVRMLGRGRPFFIKVTDPKITKIPSEQFRSVENTIKRTNLMKVRDLQLVDRSCVGNIKQGEQFKKKTYRALCIVEEPENVTQYVDKINSLSNVVVKQNTPLRVYHRRSADIREKNIYAIEARTVSGKRNLFELDVLTQAGTYVKEFVHGDLGRTNPSLSQIIGAKVDIIALDVMDVHLDFPPSILS